MKQNHYAPIGIDENGKLVYPNPQVNEAMTIGNLRKAIEHLPEDMPVLVVTPEWPYLIRPDEAFVKSILKSSESYERTLSDLSLEESHRDRDAFVIS
jgi:hypothetical protein